MKKILFVFLIGIACSCNQSAPGSNNTIKDSASAPAGQSATPRNYPYTIDHPDNWNIGSSDNTLIALSSLKAWEDGKMDESLKYFADTIWLQFDGLDKKMSNDSLKAMFTGGRNNFKTIQEKMQDWQSVISKDSSEEWVTIWYKQVWETKKGIKDSSAIINDMQIKNGKIIRLTEYTRKLH